MTGGTAGGTTPPHHPHPFPSNTGEPVYPWAPSFPCPLPFRHAAPCPLLHTLWNPALLCPFLWSPSCPSSFPCALYPPCPPLPPSSCPAPLPAPRCLTVHVAGSHSLALPPAGRGAPPPLRCSVLPALPLSAARHSALRCASLPTPPAFSGALTLSFLTPSPAGGWCLVQAPGAGGGVAGAQRAPAPRTTPPAAGVPPSPPPPAPPH